MSKLMIFPMAFYALYMWILALYMVYTRYRAIKTGEVPIKYFRTYLGNPPAEQTLIAGRHYDNQFQAPILFLITCLTLLVIGQADTLTLVLAWTFVVSRMIHSWIHLGSNRIQNRASAFILGWMALAFLWMQILYFSLR